MSTTKRPRPSNLAPIPEEEEADLDIPEAEPNLERGPSPLTPNLEVAEPEEVTVPRTKTGRKKTPVTDKKKAACAANLAKAREERLQRIQAEKEAAANQYEVESSSEDEETELVLSKKKKPALVTKMEADIMKLQLQIEKMDLQLKQKAKKQPRVIVVKREEAPPPKPLDPQTKRLLQLG